ncbi:hypothetical protein E2C01_044048 [Portunus trituberculatus]|uniref:Uncharacterized protein n=1 Tax=Portunus trituberculatus TaxID=210409 RepID=A0A5B7G183_PORTR|nr:hypothetical protein [Portunus trituberculatus]
MMQEMSATHVKLLPQRLSWCLNTKSRPVITLANNVASEGRGPPQTGAATSCNHARAPTSTGATLLLRNQFSIHHEYRPYYRKHHHNQRLPCRSFSTLTKHRHRLQRVGLSNQGALHTTCNEASEATHTSRLCVLNGRTTPVTPNPVTQYGATIKNTSLPTIPQKMLTHRQYVIPNLSQ